MVPELHLLDSSQWETAHEEARYVNPNGLVDYRLGSRAGQDR